MSEQPNLLHYGQFMQQMSIVSHLFDNRMNQRLDQKGFSLAQFNTLNHLAQQPHGQQLKISQIAAAVEVLQPAVTKIVNKLNIMGLINIKTDTADKRLKLISINIEGHKTLLELNMMFMPDIRAWHQEWSVHDMQDFTFKLKKFGLWLDANRL